MAAMSRPSKSMLPLVGRSRPPRSWNSVVFPDPLGPAIATESPATIATSTSLTAWTWPPPRLYVLETERSSYTGSLFAIDHSHLLPASVDVSEGVGGTQTSGAEASHDSCDQAAEEREADGSEHERDTHRGIERHLRGRRLDHPLTERSGKLGSLGRSRVDRCFERRAECTDQQRAPDTEDDAERTTE